MKTLHATTKNRFLIRAAMGLAVILAARPSSGQDLTMLHDLRGQWRFEIGDDIRRAAPDFNDDGWAQIFVPAAWEDEGFPGYDGYAWYRKEFPAGPEWEGKPLYLRLGFIDDVDEVYVNGQMIGFMGSFPPDYITAYNVERVYFVPPSVLRYGGNNVIAVRVYDSELQGGVVHGRVGVFENKIFLRPDVPLAGKWKFRTGDDRDWRSPSFDDRTWESAEVPAFWETQGFRDYDGFGWYRTTFRVPANLRDRRLILLVGRIDDHDEVFLNGEKVGQTGRMNGNRGQVINSEDYRRLRAYTIPQDLLSDGPNVIAVRVFDGFLHGGIYDGPVGIVTRDRWLEWSGRGEKGRKKLIDKFLEWLW